MRYLILILVAISFNSFAEKGIQMASYYVVSNEVDTNLASNQSKFTFLLREFDADQSKKIVYSVNEG